MLTGRAYSASRFALELDGVAAGLLRTAAGGEPFGEVIEEQPVGVRVGKHIGAVGYAPIVIEVVAPLAALLADWVAAMLDGTQKARAGAIVMLDYSMKVQSRLEWTAAVISGVEFPAADAASKEPASIRLTIEPERTLLVGGSGAVYQSMTGKAQKAFLPSNFRFALAGLEMAGKKVSRVSAVTVTRRSQDPAGELREHARAAGTLDVANLAIRLPESEIAAYAAWFDDFVIKGNNGDSGERTGSLTFLDPSLMEELLRVDLEGVGIFRISHERDQSDADVVRRVKVELYCEAVRLGKLASPAPNPPPASTDAVTRLAQAVVTALQQSSAARSDATAEAVVDRLLTSIPAAGEFDRGRVAGRAWSSGHARLDELEAIAGLTERDWSVLFLADGHSLLTFLADSGDIASVGPGPADLERDEFTAGIVAGAAEIHRDVIPRLRERRARGGETAG